MADFSGATCLIARINLARVSIVAAGCGQALGLTSQVSKNMIEFIIHASRPASAI